MAEGLIIAAAGTGSGKTLITLALLARMRARGVEVAAAKVGPDYIDPAFHAAATGKPCMTLDPWAMSKAELAQRLRALDESAELVLIEGVMGLFDGAAGGGGATADLAAAFDLPVVIVLDARRQGPTLAAVARGLTTFRKDVPVAGFILNRTASPAHAEMLAEAIETATGRPVLGAIGVHADLALPARHLGLVQAREHEHLQKFLNQAAEDIGAQVSLCRLANLTRPLGPAAKRIHSCDDGEFWRLAPLGQRIALADDAAFGFAYAHLLQDWREQGAEIRPFSPLADEAPDADCDAVFLPGGYPELHARALAAADRFKAGLKAAAARGALIYGECGGFMVLGEAVIDADGQGHAMCGLLPFTSSFARRQLHLGYRAFTLAESAPLPWHGPLRGHEFHYATITDAKAAPPLFANVRDSRGADLQPMGLVNGRVCGSFLHVITRHADIGGAEETPETSGKAKPEGKRP